MITDNQAAMTYSEREQLKAFATRCGSAGDIQSLERALIMIAHWMRQGRNISFTEYASQWVEAQKSRTDGNHSTLAMAETWPFSGKHCISSGGSDYYQRGRETERSDDDTEIRHAVTVIKAEYPKASPVGLWTNTEQPDQMDADTFIKEVKSCIAWIRFNNPENQKIKGFSDENPTSYGFKHLVESFNQQHYAHDSDLHYISNGAFIVAMVSLGYQIAPVGKINARFNLSSRAFKKVNK